MVRYAIIAIAAVTSQPPRATTDTTTGAAGHQGGGYVRAEALELSKGGEDMEDQSAAPDDRAGRRPAHPPGAGEFQSGGSSPCSLRRIWCPHGRRLGNGRPNPLGSTRQS